MPAPESASRYYRRQERLRYTTLAAIIAAWRRMRPGEDWAARYREDVGPKALALLAGGQIAATNEANAYIPNVLDELGIDPDGPSVPRTAFVGVAGDGRQVETLLEQSVTVSGLAYTRLGGNNASQALTSGEQWLTMAVGTVLSDTSRASESANIAARRQVSGYVRMLNAPSCSRCAILAGQFYRWNAGFERHPRCDCRHIPSSEALAGDLTTSSDAYFESLPTSAQLDERYPDLTREMRREAGIYSQEDIFTRAGAQAIRDGADIGQVVNARRGMERAQVYGRDVVMTREGITRRGRYGLARGEFEKQRGRRYEASRHVRLMPESIYEIAENRTEAIRLLRLNGYIT